MKTTRLTLACVTLAAALALPVQAFAGALYEVTVTNLTKGQSFTPLIFATHTPRVGMFEAGRPATDELATIAESGDIGPMMTYLGNLEFDVMDIQATGGLLGPGESVTVVIEGNHVFSRLSMAGMLIPTNDSFVGIDATKLANWKGLAVPAYDAGTEENDELCANIPGPVCQGAGLSAEDGEGFIYISPGISGEGDLTASGYDWRNPVAHVEIRRMRN